MTTQLNQIKADSILRDIEQSMLTPDEEERLTSKPQLLAIYQSLAAILNDRGIEGEAIERLNAHAKAAGVDLVAQEKKFKTSIFVGASLE